MPVLSLLADRDGQSQWSLTLCWLLHVLERLPLAATVADMEPLLLWHLHAQDLAINLAINLAPCERWGWWIAY